MIFFIISGLVSGIFAGMGMGGGTFLIPILTVLLSVEQKTAQLINLIVFLPMALICTIIYARKKLLKFKYLLLISVPACAVSIVAAIFSLKTSNNLLKISFGVFLIILGFVQFLKLLVDKIKKFKLQKN